MIKRKNLLGNAKLSFGLPKAMLPIADSDAIQYRVVGGNWDMATGDLDDLRAALANFVFKVLVIGEVMPILDNKKIPTGEYSVVINEVGIYVKDSYDFNDAPGEDQELGNWNFKDNSVGRTLLNRGETVRNSDFRSWRDANGKGCDFMVYSDIVYLKPSGNNTFTFKR